MGEFECGFVLLCDWIVVYLCEVDVDVWLCYGDLFGCVGCDDVFVVWFDMLCCDLLLMFV